MSKKSRSPLCVMLASECAGLETTVRSPCASNGPSAQCRHLIGGDHWCGCVPLRSAIELVAKRVCPWKICGAAPMLHGRTDARPLRSSLSARSVRLPLTTRWRLPTPPAVRLPRVYVIRPADCAPRIIVILIILRSSGATRCLFDVLSSSSPKFPQKKVAAAPDISPAAPGCAASKRSACAASAAVSHATATLQPPSHAAVRDAHAHVHSAATNSEPSHPECRMVPL